MAKSPLVTLNGLNTVWNDGVLPLYRKLDKRLDNIGQVYNFKGTKSSWTDFLTISSADRGDAYIVTSGYPAWSQDPEEFPAYNSEDAKERLLLCIKEVTSTIDPSSWETYWAPANLNLSVASSDEYGLVKLGYDETSELNTLALRLDSSDKAYVKIPGATPETAGLLIVGNGINVQNQTISIAHDDGISITGSSSPDFKIKNTGIRGIKVNGQIYRDVDELTISSNSSGAVNFYDGTTLKSIVINGWAANTWNNAIQLDELGASYQPIYIENGTSKKTKAISTISLSGNGNVASFTDSDNSDYAVKISGAGAAATDPTGANKAALLVTGSARVSEALSATKVYHAVWNDITDAIEVQDDLVAIPGCCYYFDGEKYSKTTKYCQKGIIGIHSDTAGSVLGRKGKHKELDISIGGFVLAYVDKQYKPGTPLTSSDNGGLTKMKLIDRIIHPERLVATYWKPETSDKWGDDYHKVDVDGRTWVKVR